MNVTTSLLIDGVPWGGSITTAGPWGGCWPYEPWPKPIRPLPRPWPWDRPEQPWIIPWPNPVPKPRAPVRRKKTITRKRAPIRRHTMARGKKETYITLVLDRSGSMVTCQAAALDALNEQIGAIKKNAKKGGKTFVSVIIFDDAIDIIRENVPAEQISKIESAEYQLGGSTALRDAMLTAIETMQDKQNSAKNQGFLVILISDGQENASGTSADQLKSVISELKGTDRWTFTYMLDGHTWEEAKEFALSTGVTIGNISSYTSTPSGTYRASGVIQNAAVNYMAVREKGITSSTTFYNSGDGSESKVEE
ncbi:MAG: vWA domain-containing protein [Nitrosopumilus sp.]